MAIAAEIILISTYAGQVDVRRVTVVQLAVTSVLAFLMVVPTQESDSGLLLAAVVQRVGLGRGECGDSGGDELGAEECFADPGDVDLCR